MRRVLLVAVLLPVAAGASGLDYTQLASEFDELKADPEIGAYISRDLRLQARLARLEQTKDDSLREANQSFGQISEARRRRELGTLGVLSGDPMMGSVGRRELDTTPRPADLERRGEAALNRSHEALVELVASYRDIRKAVEAEKAAAARKAERSRKPAAQKQKRP